MNYSIRMILITAIAASPTLAFQSRRHPFIPRKSNILRLPIQRLNSTPENAASSSLRATSGWVKPDTIIQNSHHSQDPVPPSPIEAILIRDRLVYIKHDDSLHLPHSNISGNKARKFFALNNVPAMDFPDAIVSYGGPQSNAMVALAAVVSSKNWELEERQESGEGDDEVSGSLWELDGIEDNIRIGAEENGDFLEFMSMESNDVGAIQDGVEADSRALLDGHDPSVTKISPLKKRFIYYTKNVPRYLRKYPNGNLLRALALGMEMRTLSHDEYSQLFGGLHGGSVMAPADLDAPVPGRSLWMPQGGACSIAEPGSDVLAKEIIDFWSSNGKGMALAVCVPGGTCTTALLLHRSIQKLMRQTSSENKNALDIRVVVIPCVGDDEYALRQMCNLDKGVGGKGDPNDMPWILRPRADIGYGSARRKAGGYFTFGEPAKAILDTFDEMNEEGLNLDLIYGAPAFSLLLQHWRSRDPTCPIAGRQIMYVHSGVWRALPVN
eukprot:CCRYP_019675-RA/>CCRYP_019675-RA protein AED:0.27 eAED:0.27 QI:192/1/1/1/0.5/0.33/3/920/495